MYVTLSLISHSRAIQMYFISKVTEEEAERIEQENKQKNLGKGEGRAEEPSPEGEEEKPSAQKKVEEEELSKVSWRFL